MFIIQHHTIYTHVCIGSSSESEASHVSQSSDGGTSNRVVCVQTSKMPPTSMCLLLLVVSVKYRLSARIDYRHPAYQLSACSLRTFLRDYPGKCLAITDRNHKSAFSHMQRQTGRKVRRGLSVGVAKDV